MLILMGLNKFRKDIEEISSAIKELQTEKEKRISSLKDLIMDGAKSDDVIKDFCTFCFGEWGEEVLNPYRELDKKIKENYEKPVLVIRTRTEGVSLLEKKYGTDIADYVNKTNLIPPRIHTETTYDLQIGIIPKDSKLEFGIKEKKVIIPTEKYLSSFYLTNSSRGKEFVDLKWDLRDGKIINNFIDLYHLIFEPTLLNYLSPYKFFKERWTPEIKFGEEAKDYFKTFFKGDEKYSEAMEILSRK